MTLTSVLLQDPTRIYVLNCKYCGNCTLGWSSYTTQTQTYPGGCAFCNIRPYDENRDLGLREQFSRCTECWSCGVVLRDTFSALQNPTRRCLYCEYVCDGACLKVWCRESTVGFAWESSWEMVWGNMKTSPRVDIEEILKEREWESRKIGEKLRGI